MNTKVKTMTDDEYQKKYDELVDKGLIGVDKDYTSFLLAICFLLAVLLVNIIILKHNGII